MNYVKHITHLDPIRICIGFLWSYTLHYSSVPMCGYKANKIFFSNS